MSDDPARARLFAIHAARFVGAVLAAVGALAVAGRIALPFPAGHALFFAGVLGALFVPTLLARRWKSPPP